MPYLLGASTPVTTVTTPSSASARRESMCLMRACGYGECNILPTSMPGTLRSSAYLPWPVVLPAESISAIGLPIIEKSDMVAFERKYQFTSECSTPSGIVAVIPFRSSVNCGLLQQRMTILCSGTNLLVALNEYSHCD